MSFYDLENFLCEESDDVKINRKVLSMISGMVDPKFLYVVDESKSPVDAMSRLKNLVCPDNEVAKSGLKKKLYSLRLEPGTTLQAHIDQVLKICRILKSMNEPVNDGFVLLESLSDDYESIVDHYLTLMDVQGSLPAVDHIIRRLLEKEASMTDKSRSSVSALAARKEKRKEIICFRCKQKGHIARYCNFEKQESLVVIGGNKQPLSHWYIDSGAPSHMTSVRSWFSNYIKIKPIPVSVASGAVMYAMRQGTVIFEADSRYICLNQVLHIPELNKNLVSVSRLIDRGVQVQFKKDGVELEKDGIRLFGRRDNNMFVLKPKIAILDVENACLITEKSPMDLLELWHQRLGHFHLNGIRNLSEKDLVDGLPSFNFSKNPKLFCQGCAEGI